jgi:superfamily II DNA/RNA helicase
LGLAPELIDAAAGLGWLQPTEIQMQALPGILAGHDVILQSPTGSGKTAAYLLPVIQRMLDAAAPQPERPRRLRALVLAPTRELAVQIGAIAHGLAPRWRTVVAVGGLSINPQMMALRGGAELVVATPGRLLDLLAQRALTLADLRYCVLDEADRLLDLGFADEIGRLLAQLPTHRSTPRSTHKPARCQMLMCSATWPDAVAALATRALHDPLRVAVSESVSSAAPLIAQRAIVVDTARRTTLLRHLLSSEGWQRALVFVATQYATEHVADKLRQAGVAAAALHGQLSQGRRSQVLADLHQGRLQVLVATDLAARGIDVQRLDAVVNHDLPRSALDHTHRIGRTGRAGAAGVAISFIAADAPGSEAHFRLIEKRQLQRVAREQVPGFEPTAAPLAPVVDAHGGVKGRRQSKKDKLRAAQAAQTLESETPPAAEPEAGPKKQPESQPEFQPESQPKLGQD